MNHQKRGQFLNRFGTTSGGDPLSLAEIRKGLAELENAINAIYNGRMNDVSTPSQVIYSESNVIWNVNTQSSLNFPFKITKVGAGVYRVGPGWVEVRRRWNTDISIGDNTNFESDYQVMAYFPGTGGDSGISDLTLGVGSFWGLVVLAAETRDGGGIQFSAQSIDLGSVQDPIQAMPTNSWYAGFNFPPDYFPNVTIQDGLGLSGGWTQTVVIGTVNLSTESADFSNPKSEINQIAYNDFYGQWSPHSPIIQGLYDNTTIYYYGEVVTTPFNYAITDVSGPLYGVPFSGGHYRVNRWRMVAAGYAVCGINPTAWAPLTASSEAWSPFETFATTS